jgi:hypothetical protein
MKMKIGVATLILLLMVGPIGCAAYEAITGQTALKIRQQEAEIAFQATAKAAYEVASIREVEKQESQRIRDYYAYLATTGQTATTKENMSGNSGLNLSFLQNVSIGWQFLLVAGSLGIAIWLLLRRSD